MPAAPPPPRRHTLLCRPNAPRPRLRCLQGDVEGARRGYEKAMRMRCNGQQSVAAHLALAALQFGQHNYLEALKL